MSRINNYEELVAARKEAEGRIAIQKEIIRAGVDEVREKLEPFLYLLPLLNIFKKRDGRNPVLKGVASVGIDLLFGQNLLAKSNWFMRLIVPMFLKGVSSRLLK